MKTRQTAFFNEALVIIKTNKPWDKRTYFRIAMRLQIYNCIINFIIYPIFRESSLNMLYNLFSILKQSKFNCGNEIARK